MNDLIQRTINDLLKKIIDIMKTEYDCDLTLDILGKNAYIWLDNEVNAQWHVKSMDEVKAALKAFARKGILLDEVIKHDTRPVWYLKGRGCRIRLTPIWNTDEGSSCRLVKVGENTITQPVYKLICDADPATLNDMKED